MNLSQEVISIVESMESFKIWGFRFNVNKGFDLVSDQTPDKKDPDPAWQLPVKVDPEYAMKTDVTRPILLGTWFKDGEFRKILIDGNHRFYKAMKNGDPLLVKTLDFDQTMSIMTSEDPSKKEDMLKAAQAAKGSSNA